MIKELDDVDEGNYYNMRRLLGNINEQKVEHGFLYVTSRMLGKDPTPEITSFLTRESLL